ncbi:MAG: PHP domain-containing protein [Bacteroidota bacterium]
MTNKDIAKTFQFLGNIMELHGENQFKIRSYQNAYLNLRKLATPLSDMSAEDRASIKGVGKAITAKIQELLDTGKMETLERYKSQTPEGVQEMLNIKGFGPKKIRVIWKDLGAETIGELLYAVNENRLIELKGFGQKTQEDLKNKLEYYQKSKDQYHLASLLGEANDLLDHIRQGLALSKIILVGAIARQSNIVDKIEILVATEKTIIDTFLLKEGLEKLGEEADALQFKTSNDTPLTVYTCTASAFGSKEFRYTASNDFMTAFLKQFPAEDFRSLAEEKQVFDQVDLPYIPKPLREDEWALELAIKNELPVLIQGNEIKGVLHAHSTYSDGINSIEEMALESQRLGYAYLGMTDHSKSAFYANGLKEERVLQQFQEIDLLNQKLAPFKIFKGIESDILNDGSLDYEEELLSQFDFIIASVHSNLRMDQEKANNRLIKAIENPFTTILGHPTGRLLLSREGYPIDHKLIIDACAANGVVIELNANPYRLDLDWSWIPYAIEKGVKIAINPDAHSNGGIQDIKYGVLSAQKGGLTAETCLNTMNVNEFEQFISLSK